MGAPAPGNDCYVPGRRSRGLLVVTGTTGRTSCGTPERLRPSSTFHATPPRTSQCVPLPTFHSGDGTGGVMYQSAWLYGRMWETPSRWIYPVRRCGVAAPLLRSRRVLAVGRFVKYGYARGSWLLTTAARDLLLGFVISIARRVDIPMGVLLHASTAFADFFNVLLLRAFRLSLSTRRFMDVGRLMRVVFNRV